MSRRRSPKVRVPPKKIIVDNKRRLEQFDAPEQPFIYDGSFESITRYASVDQTYIAPQDPNGFDYAINFGVVRGSRITASSYLDGYIQDAQYIDIEGVNISGYDYFRAGEIMYTNDGGKVISFEIKDTNGTTRFYRINYSDAGTSSPLNLFHWNYQTQTTTIDNNFIRLSYFTKVNPDGTIQWLNKTAHDQDPTQDLLVADLMGLHMDMIERCYLVEMKTFS